MSKLIKSGLILLIVAFTLGIVVIFFNYFSDYKISEKYNNNSGTVIVYDLKWGFSIIALCFNCLYYIAAIVISVIAIIKNKWFLSLTAGILGVLVSSVILSSLILFVSTTKGYIDPSLKLIYGVLCTIGGIITIVGSSKQYKELKKTKENQE